VVTVAHVQSVDHVKIVAEIAVVAAETVAVVETTEVDVEMIAEVAVKTATVVSQTADHVRLSQLQTTQCRSASKTNSTANLTVTNKP
jgi:hypothetical protein